MVSLEPPLCEFGLIAPDFRLLGTDGRFWTLSECMGKNGLLVMFICNHCPYVKAVHARILRDVHELKGHGIGCVAIMPNDTEKYPEDNYENMQRIAKEYDYPFPYLWDDTQAVAQAYGAVCTPDFFGYNADYQLQYRGRLDASRKETAPESVRRDLFEAMKLIAQTGQGPKEQFASMGCSIKWKENSQ